MKYFDWNELKNARLKAEREVGFEDVLTALDEGRLLAIVEHSNQERYPGQKMYVIEINNYAYLVPYIEDDAKIFLKTIIPNRKAAKKYLKGDNDG